ncbi:GHMP family kinase ATP-binding protein [Nitrospira sp. M1]
MIITQTPVRISFFGGGTDYPEHFTAYGGATLGASIDKYTTISVTPLTKFFDHRIRVSYSRMELCTSVEELQHPSIRECLRYVNIDGGVEMSVVNDLPARTGLGSSSSFTVGLLHALHAFKGELVSTEQLAKESVYVEREMIKERVGLQDQYTCALGGVVNLEFHDVDRVDVRPLIVQKERLAALEERLLLFYTGQQRTAHDILEHQMSRTKNGDVVSQLTHMQSLVQEGATILCNGRDLREFGELLQESWMYKRQLSDAISNSLIDDAYERACRAGAVGGKLLGAGGGGFLLLYVEPYNQKAVRQSLVGMPEVNFHFESQGSRLIFYRP